MKRFNVLNILVLILVLFLSGLSKEQTREGETADDYLIKFIEYLEKDAINANNYFQKAINLDPTKKIYIEIMEYMVDGKFVEALKLLEQRKNQTQGERERKVIQILAAKTHFMWAEALRKKYDYINAIAHYEVAYGIDSIYRRNQSAIDLHNIGFLYASLGQNQKALEYYEKVLSIFKELENKANEAVLLGNLMFIWDEMSKNSLAIFFHRFMRPSTLLPLKSNGLKSTMPL